MFDKFIAKLLSRSAIRVVLSLALGLVIGLKIDGGAEVICAVADVLSVAVQGCLE
jgi:hypothetical protein